MTPEIQHIPIKGNLTLKQVVAYTIGIATIIVAIVTLYFNIVGKIENAAKVSDNNNEILKEIRADRKEEVRMNNIRLSEIESRQRTQDIRLTIMEVELKK